MKKYKMGVPLPQTTTEQPVRQLSPIEIAGQAFVTLLAGGLVVFLAFGVAGIINSMHQAIMAAAIIVGLSASGFLLLGAGSVWHITVYVVENISHHDWDGDGYTGEPPKMYINPYQGRAQAQREAMDEWRDGLVAFVRGCEATGTGGPAWEKRIGRKKYEDYRDTLLGAGFAVWINGNNHLQGWKLVADAESIVNQIFDLPHPT